MKVTTPTRSRALSRAVALGALCALALLSCASASATLSSEEVSETLSAARRALGWDELVASGGAVRVEGEARFLGTDARQTLLFDGSGRFVQDIEGPLRQSDGTDGRVAWSRDWTDTPSELILGDLAAAQVSTLLLTGGWVAADGVLSFERVASASADRIALGFEHADGVLVGTIALDAATHLPVSATFGSDDSVSTWSFSGYRDRGGFRFPDRIELEQAGLKQDLDTRSVARVERPDDAVFAPRLPPPGGVSFDPDVSAALEVKRVPSGHLLVHPTVNGEDLGWFIFDSGAGTNCISTHVTGSLSDGPIGEIAARGVGGTVPARFWRADELRLGPLTVADPVFMELDLAFLEAPFGVPVAGIVGYELLGRCVAELDVVGAAISLHDPATYALPADGRWEEALIYGRTPSVRATFEGVDGVFKIDTGAADTVTFHYQTVHDLELTEGRTTTSGRAGGVGGVVPTREGVLTAFRLGGHAFDAVPASFVLEDRGAFSDDYVAGNIGGKLLEPFRLVFDYQGRRLGFVPR